MKISVVIPLYNKKDTILRSLNSVLSQTVMPDEIIVVNDGSTDGSEQVIGIIKNPLVKLISQPNQGVSAARNRGIAEAENDWVAFLDADDEWLPDFIQTITELIVKFPECGVAATSYFMQFPEGTLMKNLLRKLSFSEDQGILDNYFKVAACSHPPIQSSAVAVKKVAIQSVGGFPDGVTSGEDLLTWARLAADYPIAYSTVPQSVFTQNPAHIYLSRPTRLPQIPDNVGNNLAILAKSKRRIKGLRRYISQWHKMRSSIYLRLGFRSRSFNESVISLFYYPGNYRVMFYLLLLAWPTSCINMIFRKSYRR